MSKINVELMNSVARRIRRNFPTNTGWRFVVTGSDLNMIGGTNKFDSGKLYLVYSDNKGNSWDIREYRGI